LWREALGPEERAAVLERCAPLAATHGYDLEACVRMAEVTS
jgi:hypothetical protein